MCACVSVFGVFEVNTVTDGGEQLGHRLPEIIHTTRMKGKKKQLVSGRKEVERPGGDVRFAAIRAITESGDTSR